MKLYNSLTGKKENIIKPKWRRLRLFVCGPTVYDDAHIGHARTYLVFDSFVRYLRFLRWKVFYLQNITNIDDKIIARAKKERKNPLALAKFFEKRYRQDMKKIGIVSVNHYARATDFIPEIVRQVQILIKRGYAYKISDGYYFDIKKFKDYGKLSKRTALQAEDAVSRIDENINKKNKGDFNLWKISRAGEPAWNTPLGKGRPGWHIEDTAISGKFFGPQYDLHGGAIDLKFPHHEAEIAQAEAASGKKPFVKIWMHTGLLYVDGKKMSKTLKNFITIRDFLKKYSPQTLRFLILKHHYRSPLNYNKKTANQAEADICSIKEFLAKLELAAKYGGQKPSSVLKTLSETEKTFHKALQEDFNTPEALAAVFKMINSLQVRVWKMSRREAKKISYEFRGWFGTLGLEFKKEKIPPKLRRLADKREIFRSNKQFKQADALRKKIQRVGYEIEDTPLGPLILPKDKNRSNRSKN